MAKGYWNNLYNIKIARCSQEKTPEMYILLEKSSLSRFLTRQIQVWPKCTRLKPCACVLSYFCNNKNKQQREREPSCCECLTQTDNARFSCNRHDSGVHCRSLVEEGALASPFGRFKHTHTHTQVTFLDQQRQCWHRLFRSSLNNTPCGLIWWQQVFSTKYLSTFFPEMYIHFDRLEIN
jgi:hypothetical protein